MKAQDVVASLEHAKTCPEVSFYAESVATCEAVDDYTVKITTDGPSATLLYDLCHHGNAILPKALLDQGHDFGQEPIGCLLYTSCSGATAGSRWRKRWPKAGSSCAGSAGVPVFSG